VQPDQPNRKETTVNRVFILGAGASKFAGYPLAPELWAFLRDHSGGHVQAEKRREEVVRLVEHVVREYVPPEQYDRPNLEEIFTYLDLASLGTTLIQLEKTDWRRLRLGVMGMIADAFQWYQYSLWPMLSGNGGVSEILGLWSAFLEPGDVLITFNWDLLHESARWQVALL
jgi:hypothetical protein